MHGANYQLRDEIKAYWSARAATFDLQPGHEIFCDAERAAWRALILHHLGKGRGPCCALTLAAARGWSRLMADLGYAVTGMDWPEPMLGRARSKAAARGRAICFLLGDAERTMEPDGAYSVLVARHLVWTLVDPSATFAEWQRVLRPGGKMLLIDGDFVSPTWVARLRGLVRTLLRAGASADALVAGAS